MNTPKTAGSLTSGLLARKGLAQPAMRRQTVTGLGPRAVTPLDDLGWDDMGEDMQHAPSPVAAHIAAIQETLDRRRAERRTESTTVAAAVPTVPAILPIEVPLPPAQTNTDRKGKVRSAFTLRIDADRHLRLRLLSAVTNCSAQQLLTGALDALIRQHPEIDALAANPKLRQRSSDTGTE